MTALESTLIGAADPRAVIEPEASQWRLIWLAFCRNKLAVAGGIVVLLLYLVAAFSEVLSPFDPSDYSAVNVYHPPQALQFIDTAEDGSWTFRRMSST